MDIEILGCSSPRIMETANEVYDICIYDKQLPSITMANWGKIFKKNIQKLMIIHDDLQLQPYSNHPMAILSHPVSNLNFKFFAR